MKLELNIETIRDLSDEDLKAADGGREEITKLVNSLVCVSGATWFASCETLHICQ